MSDKKEKVSEAFMLIAKLATLLGVKSIKDLPALWDHQVDALWKIRLNGHTKAIEGVPPFHALIEFNGMPWAFLSPYGGTFVHYGAVNEDTFCDAILAAIVKASGGNQP